MIYGLKENQLFLRKIHIDLRLFAEGNIINNYTEPNTK